MGCNFDGGLTWLALGKARAGSDLDSFRVEIPDVDLERVDATISPSNMDMFMPYGQGPVVGPINVSKISIGPRTVDGVANGNVVTVHFNILSSYSTPTDFLQPDAISYILVLNNKSTLSALTRLGRRMRGQLGPDRINKKIWHVRRVVISCPDSDTDAAALAAAVVVKKFTTRQSRCSHMKSRKPWCC